MQVGYRWRSAGPDQWRFDATLGTRPVSWLLLMLQSFNTVSQSANAVLEPAMRQHKLQVSAVYDINKTWSAQLGVFGRQGGRVIKNWCSLHRRFSPFSQSSKVGPSRAFR